MDRVSAARASAEIPAVVDQAFCFAGGGDVVRCLTWRNYAASREARLNPDQKLSVDRGHIIVRGNHIRIGQVRAPRRPDEAELA